MIKSVLYCTCNLHLNVIKGFSITVLEDNLVLVRNQLPGLVNKDGKWFLCSLMLICLLFATSLVVVVAASPGHGKHTAILFCFLAWEATETSYISEHKRDLCLQEPLVHDQPDRKIFQGQQSYRFLQAVKVLHSAKCTELDQLGRCHINLILQFISLIIVKVERKQLM